MILNKEARAHSKFFGVCKVAMEASAICVAGVPSAPTLSVHLRYEAEGIWVRLGTESYLSVQKHCDS